MREPSIDIDELPYITALLDDDGAVVAVNGHWTSFAEQNGAVQGKAGVGSNYLDVLSNDPDGDGLLEQLRALLDRDVDAVRHDYPCHSPNERRWFRLHAVRAGERVATIHQSISREVWLASAVDGLPDALVELDTHGDLVGAGPAWLELVGGELPAQLDKGWLESLHVDDRPPAMRAVRETVRSGDTTRLRVRVLDRDGDWTHQQLACGPRVVDGRTVGVLVSVTDVTDDVRIHTDLTRQLATDPLTGLTSRPTLVEHLRVALGAAQRSGLYTGLVFADLDGFKAVNDTHGHLAGDQLLKVLARRMQAAVRPGDVVSRFAGDEFVVLVQRLADPERVEDAADRIHAAVTDSPVDLGDGVAVEVGVSVGTAVAEAGDRPEDVLARADEAMYRDKRGRSSSSR